MVDILMSSKPISTTARAVGQQVRLQVAQHRKLAVLVKDCWNVAENRELASMLASMLVGVNGA